MKKIPFIVSLLITVLIVFVLNKKWGGTPPVGKLISPQQGFWQNAEPVDADFSADIKFPELNGKAEVLFDERLVPHIFAENETDAYFIQGYLHAKFRLFQMDLQTKAAEGRASEIAGEKAISFDREQRRLGMRFAAERAIEEINKDKESKDAYDAYTAGVNAWISSLKESELPVEYKLLDFKPEKWSNLRTALLLKMMAKMLSSGTEDDLAYTNAKSVFTPDELKMLYPQVPDSLMPIVPKGTVFEKPGIVPVAPANVDSLYFTKSIASSEIEISKPDINNGSNNWVVAGSKTKSGVPILCNDPHLELSLPSIWYEMQIVTPTSNVYGVSLPGSPFVIIGFNDSISWGVTNAQRDVKDYYDIKFKDKTKKEYWLNGEWTPTKLRYEEIKVKDGATVFDTVAYTVFGPVMYDESFTNEEEAKPRNLAVRWTAHEPSNEGHTFYLLNRAKNYDDYENAIKTFSCPGQNFVFASKAGDIAIWQQGKFPARWDRQGLYIMPGADSSFMWQGYIPQAENPHSKNPQQGFLQSANQRPADASYPYFIPGAYITARGITINNVLDSSNGITVEDMMKLQGNYFNTTAQDVLPILFNNINETNLTDNEKRYLGILRTWDLMAGPDSKGQTIYQCWWDSLMTGIWNDELALSKPASPMPTSQTTLEVLKRDSTTHFIDDINTDKKETLQDVVTSAFKKASQTLAQNEVAGKLEWSKFKDPTIYHLLKNNLLPFARTGLHVGGNGDIVNAVTHSHGPSWRMIVEMKNNTEAYGVYPGGQNGNVGSKFYDNFVDQWAAGKYYKLWMMNTGDKLDKKVKWRMNFDKTNN